MDEDWDDPPTGVLNAKLEEVRAKVARQISSIPPKP
jgi:hypothetical protein